MAKLQVTDPYHIAIVGAGALLPGAADAAAFWANVAAGRDCARDVPPGRWPIDPASAHQPGGPAPDKVYSLRGYFLDAIPTDPATYEEKAPSLQPSLFDFDNENEEGSDHA